MNEKVLRKELKELDEMDKTGLNSEDFMDVNNRSTFIRAELNAYKQGQQERDKYWIVNLETIFKLNKIPEDIANQIRDFMSELLKEAKE